MSTSTMIDSNFSDSEPLIDGFLHRLMEKARPKVLLLGQRASVTEDQTEPLLEALRDRYQLSADLPSDFNLLFAMNTAGDPQSVAAWIADRVRNQPFPESLATIANLPWNAVFTSSVCPLVGRAFRASWRMPQDVAAATQIPDTPQSPHRLTITWLFGRLDEDAGSDRAAPMIARLALRQRRLAAANLLSRIPAVVSHYGTLVVERLDPRDDWLSKDDLIDVIAAMQPGQVHWFSWPAGAVIDGDLEELRQDGRLVLHRASLTDVLARAASTGLLPQMLPAGQDSDGRTVLLNGQQVAIPRSLLARADALGHVMDATLPTPPPLDANAEYNLVREFLRDPIGSATVWEAVNRRIVVHRSHQPLLIEAVRRAVRDLGERRRPVLLMGPSGSGRSVSLAWLATEAAQDCNALVYFVEGNTPLPEELVEDLAKFATSKGAAATILVWDANQTPTEYQRLVESASSRGDNLVVVGSCYRTIRPVQRSEVIQAEPLLNTAERDGFAQLFRRLGLKIDPKSLPDLPDERLLVLLYRFVRIARPQLAGALASEHEHFSSQVAQDLAPIGLVARSERALEQAMIEVGLQPSGSVLQPILEQPGWQRSRADELIATVMAVGRYDLKLPFELAVRACVTIGNDAATWTNVEKILRDVDLIDIDPDSDGIVRITPRHQIEARMLCDTLLGGPDKEMQIFARLVDAARPGEGLGAAGDPELRFLNELCAAIGPNAPEWLAGGRYRKLYGTLASALRKRRATAPLHTELAMQEAILWREDLFDREDAQKRAPDDAVSNVEQAIELLDSAISIVRKEGRRLRHLRNLRVERATLIGTLTFQLIAMGGNRGEVMARLDQVRSETTRIADSDPSFYYPRDVMLWTACDAFVAPCLTPEDRATLQADLRSTMLEIREDDLPVDQLEKFLDKKRRVGDLLKDNELSQEALLRLRELGSTIPDRLAALDLAGEVLARDTVEAGDQDRLLRAKQILTEADAIRHLDSPGRRLLLRLSWRLSTGRNLFTREQSPAPWLPADIALCRSLAERLVVDAGGDPPQQFLFLLATLFWLEGRYMNAREAWQELERVSDRGTQYRIRKHLIVYNVTGKPAIFHGRIASVHPNGRTGRMRLDENGQQIHISAGDFRQSALRRDENLAIHVAFNYLGPIAIPA